MRGAAVADLILHLEQHGQTLGEWPLSAGPLSLTLRNPVTGETVATFRAEVPGQRPPQTLPVTDENFDAPTERKPIREIDLGPPETDMQLVGAHFDEVGRAGLPANADLERIPGLGVAKIERFGDDILALVREHGRAPQD